MFSIIIPLYNKSAYVEKCLQSVFDQTCQDFEVIIVNNGSTDDGPAKVIQFINKFYKTIPDPSLPGSNDVQTWNLEPGTLNPEPGTLNLEPGTLTAQHSTLNSQRSTLNSQRSTLNSEPGIKLLNQSNLGVSVARNKGVKASKSDYIAFLDADDWWEPAFLEEMKGLIESFPEAGIYGSGYYLVKNKRKRIAPIGVDHTFDKGIINYFRVYAKTLCMPLTSISVIIPKTIFDIENGFKQELKLGEDFDLWIRVALKYPVAFLNKPLANYNQDMDLTHRAVGNLYNPENHILWNLGYLANEEQSDPDLKQLLDNLRVYMLLPYFLSDEYHESARQELGKVDWAKQPQSKKYLYNTPFFLLKIYQVLLQTGSYIKQWLIRKTSKFR